MCGDSTINAAAGEECEDGNDEPWDGCNLACHENFVAGEFAVSEGPQWFDDPPTYSCREACALLFGDAAADYACSTSQDGIDHRAWLDGWDDSTYCEQSTDEDYKKSNTYDCGMTSCSFSAYVNDHGCMNINYCWR